MEQTPQKIEKKLFDRSELNNIADLLQTDVRIKNEDSTNLVAQNLRYVFVLIGMLPNQIPNKIEQDVLLDFIKNNYKLLHPDEIKIAFQMGVKGDLNTVKPNLDMNCFGLFSIKYFCSVMSAYNEFRIKVAVELDHQQKKFLNELPYIPDTVKKQQAQREFDLNVIKPIFEKYKTYKKLDCAFTPPRMIYDSLTGVHQIKEFTKEEKLEINEQAKKNLIERQNQIKESRVKSYAEHKMKLKLMNELAEPMTADKEIVAECHLICIQKCFDIMIDKNFNF